MENEQLEISTRNGYGFPGSSVVLIGTLLSLQPISVDDQPGSEPSMLAIR